MTRKRSSLGPLMCYHGCSRDTAEDILANKAGITPSRNKWDWLGSGIYFWVDSWARGVDWALNGKGISDPYVVGAYVQPGLCLNLSDFAVSDQVLEAFNLFETASIDTGFKLPRNKDFFQRNLDCAVLEFLHILREDRNLPPYETILGVFEEGEEIYNGSFFKQKTHMQLVVRENHEDCIIGYFRVPGIEEAIKHIKKKKKK